MSSDNMNLRKAAEMALKDWLANDEGVVRFGMELKPEWVSTVSHGFLSGYEEALRQALARQEQEQYVTEVVAMHEDGTYTTRRIPLPKREWVGLTDEEIHELTCHVGLVRYFEAKLKEKNT